MALPEFSMRTLLEAGAHFGHQTHRWNPKMDRYIFGSRSNIHIIDLSQSIPLLHQALVKVREVAAAKSTNADVKALAAMIDKDHTAAGEKMTSVVATAAPNVAVPTTLDERRQGLIDNLKAATPADFDKVYLTQQVAAHNETLTLLNGFSGNTDAPALATLARELVAPVTMHRDRAQALLDAMK